MRLFKNNQNQIGFTLIEMILVIAILGIIMSLLFLLIDPMMMMKKARDSVRKQDLQTISTYLSLYFEKNGKLPSGSTNFCKPGDVEGSDDRSIYEGCTGYDKSWIKDLVTSGMAPVVSDDPDNPDKICPPSSPAGTKKGFYEYWVNQIQKRRWCWEFVEGHFVLMAGLENLDDPDCLKGHPTNANGIYYFRSLVPSRCTYLLQDGVLVEFLPWDDACSCPDACYDSSSC